MAGLYGTLMGNQDYQVPTTMSVFGNAATTPANLTTSNARIEALRQNLANAQAQVEAANSTQGKSQSAVDRLADYYLQQYKNGNVTAMPTAVRNQSDSYYERMAKNQAMKTLGLLQGETIYTDNGSRMGNPSAEKSAILALLNDKSGSNNSAFTDAQNAVNTAQEKLNNALARQQMQIQAGQDAVNWGQTAMNAEQQGIANAAQMYQQAMQGEAIRNAIMNNAIGTVGFGGGK